MRIADTSAQDVRIEPTKKPLRRIGIAAVVVLTLGLLVFSFPALTRWATASVTVSGDRLRVATVERGDLVRDVSVQGRIVAAVSPTLYAPAAGTITLSVEAGASVEKDQILAIVDSPLLTNELQQADATLQQQTVELERQRIESRQQSLETRKQADLAGVTLVAAKREKRRADAANELKVISVIDYEKAQDDLQNAELAHAHAIADADLFEERLEFELRAAELALQRQELRVNDLRRQVDELSIRSPVSGIVGDLLVDQKSVVSRDTPVMAVVDLSQFEIDALVPETYADDLAIGMAAEIDAGGRKFSGQLVAISPEIVANQVLSRVRFVDEAPANLRQNQRLSTRILLEQRDDVLMLKRGQFLDSGGGRVAYVLDGKGSAERRSIEIGARSLGAVEVLGGLSEGDRVVISSLEPFRGADTALIAN